MNDGMMSVEQLAQDVKEGRIDTVLACQIDMQGRLMGKRFQAEFFLESAIDETHSCNYLQAADMEMGNRRGIQVHELGGGLWRLRHEAGSGHTAQIALARGNGFGAV